jgi:hypothetical protein
MSVVIDGSTGITGNNGSAATPALSGDDPDTGVFFPTANAVSLSTGGMERVSITNNHTLVKNQVELQSDLVISNDQGFAGFSLNNGTLQLLLYTPLFDPGTFDLTGLFAISGNVGTAGQVLTSGGSGAAPSWAVAGTPILTWVKQASTSGSAIDFTGIPATVREIVLIYNSVSLSATADFLIQIGPSGGVETTGYNSRSVAVAANAAASTSSTSGFCMLGFSTAPATAQVNLWRIGTTNEWQMSASGMRDAATSLNAAGSKTLASALTQVRCTRTGSVTYTAGSILLGYR